MASQPRQRFVVGLITLVLITIGWLAFFDLLEPAVVFVVSLVALILMWEYSSPFSVQLSWRRRIRWLIVGGYVVFIVYAMYVVTSFVA